MKQAFATLCAVFALILVYSAFSSGPASRSHAAPVASATPDPFVVQLTSSTLGGFLTTFASNATDISADGRFMVVESNGDIATEKIPTYKPDGTLNANPRNNEDGNRELFLIDYAQRRIFQITNTQNVPNPPASPTPTPTPSPTPSPTPGASPTPTPSPVPTPADISTIKIEISSNRPMISLQPALSSGKRVYTIVFSTNAPTPTKFDGTDPAGALAADGNQEVWTYQLPPVADVDLTTGADLPTQDLSAGTFTQITNTGASRVPSPGSATDFPFVADDNREATISDDGKIIAFVSTRSNDLIHTGDTDGTPEIFIFNRNSSAFTQVTHTTGGINNGVLFSPFTANPCLSADGGVLAFVSNANLTGDNNDDGKGNGNGEIFVANYNGTISNLRQVTKTKNDATVSTVNLFSTGRRLSRDGTLLAFDSLADDPKANTTANEGFYAIFVYAIASDTFTQVGLRALPPDGDFGFVHFPTFTDYDNVLNPGTLVFGSALNFLPDGTFPSEADDPTGLNPDRQSQLFATQAHATSTNTFTRLTTNPVTSGLGFLRALTSNSSRRTAFSFSGDLGAGNSDSSTEVFYLLQPPGTDSNSTLTFFTGASSFPVPTATPTPTPSATPTPSPSPSPSPTASPTPATMAPGLAPGELTIVQATVPLAPANTNASGASETKRVPALPVELNGVTVGVNGVAAGLYSVNNSPSQINFVIPPGLFADSTVPAAVVINNNGSVSRSLIQLVPTQPDLFALAGNRAAVLNITNPNNRLSEPPGGFPVTSDDGTGTQVPTVLEFTLTGVRFATPGSVIVTFGTTDVSGAALFVGPNLEMPGFDLVDITLPATLAGVGDVPIVITISPGVGAYTSRPIDTAPHIKISP